MIGAGAWSAATELRRRRLGASKATLVEPFTTSTATPVFKWNAYWARAITCFA